MKNIYLAIPYGGMEKSSLRQTKLAVVSAIKKGYNPFSLIAYATQFEGDPEIGSDWSYWENIAEEYLQWCNEVWVQLPDEGLDKIKQSEGTQGEIERAKYLGKKIRLFELDENHEIEFII